MKKGRKKNMSSPKDYVHYLEEVSETGALRGGSPLPLGVHLQEDGANFSIFSRNATGVTLVFSDGEKDGEPTSEINFDPVYNRTGDVWHVWVKGVRRGQLYGYRIEGPYQPEEGHRFNPNKLLLDPLAEAITYHKGWDFGNALGYDPESPEEDISFSEENNADFMPKCILPLRHFNWDGDDVLKRPATDTIIYETHVRGFTIHDSSDVAESGTYRGLVEKIPYLKNLGITAVELMPVQEFNENEITRKNPETGEALKNYWGYNPVGFLAPESSYCSHGTVGQQVLEFKEMVKSFHKAGIEVIVDIVLNHTAEGNQLGPTLCLRGVDNSIYYMLEENKRFYKDYSGTGNTIKADQPVVRDFILTVLRHWVIEMHVDGFRFDLAAVLGRDEEGEVLLDSPLLDRIAEDPILRETKLIAEAWDIGDSYRVGEFSDPRWAEWNPRFRDDVRRFWRGDDGMMADFACRITGSADLYQEYGKGPESSINYITSHDGFTLNDLVSYKHKHNEANGEENRDGTDDNYSENYGVEGETDDPEIEAIRKRQIKNYILTLFISRGVPMILGGDEFRRTQRGNNNAYCQDNEISWYDWGFLEKNKDIHRFVKGMISFRKNHGVLCVPRFYTHENLIWRNPEGNEPNWVDPKQKCLACTILADGEPNLGLIFNAYVEAVEFSLSKPPRGGTWYLVANTMENNPADLHDPGKEQKLDDQKRIQIGPRSAVILMEKE